MTKIKIAKKEGEDDLKSSRAKAIARISQISNQLQAAEGGIRKYIFSAETCSFFQNNINPL